MARKSPGHSFSPKVGRLLRESVYLLLIGIALYLIMILVTYDRSDAGWSHSGIFNEVQNAGGYAGAWVSDLLLYLFGVSAWWWVAFFLSTVAWSYRRIDSGGIFDKQSMALSISGFLLLLAASSGLESLRFYTLNAALPLIPKKSVDPAAEVSADPSTHKVEVRSETPRERLAAALTEVGYAPA